MVSVPRLIVGPQPPYLVCTGYIWNQTITPGTHWKRNPGRPRHTWVRRVLADVHLSAQEAWTAAGDRVEWRALRSSADYAIWWWWWNVEMIETIWFVRLDEAEMRKNVVWKWRKCRGKVEEGDETGIRFANNMAKWSWKSILPTSLTSSLNDLQRRWWCDFTTLIRLFYDLQ